MPATSSVRTATRREILAATAACAIVAKLPPVQGYAGASDPRPDLVLRDGWLLVPGDMA